MHILTAREFTRTIVDDFIESSRAFRAGRRADHRSAVVGLLFFEDSLRTRVGYEVAATRLGAATTTVFNLKQSAAMGTPETLDDTIRSVAGWLDALCVRHPDEDAVPRIARSAGIPVINCGNGQDEHPTQALVDLFAIEELIGGIDGLRIAIVGDLNAMRSAHSLALALSVYQRVQIRCICPDGLGLPSQVLEPVRCSGTTVESTALFDVAGMDVVYVCGLPAKTRAGELSDEDQAAYRITRPRANAMAPHARILCPLPRIDEVHRDVDDTVQAGYFTQSDLSVWMRMAVLDRVLTAQHAGM